MILILGILVIFGAGLALGYGLGIRNQPTTEVHNHYHGNTPADKLQNYLSVIREVDDRTVVDDA